MQLCKGIEQRRYDDIESKKAKHKLHFKAHHAQKEIEIDKRKMKRLKSNLEIVPEDCAGLKDKEKELETIKKDRRMQ